MLRGVARSVSWMFSMTSSVAVEVVVRLEKRFQIYAHMSIVTIHDQTRSQSSIQRSPNLVTKDETSPSVIVAKLDLI